MAAAVLPSNSRCSLLEIGLGRIDGPSVNVLTCGDGDLSYSLALVNNLKKTFGGDETKSMRVIATCFLAGDELDKTHPEAESFKSGIVELGCEVRTGVDATRLHELFEPKYFHRIVWNFPQHPGRHVFYFKVNTIHIVCVCVQLYFICPLF
jgi:hypothetical protein